MLTLGIETSCDETGIAVTDGGSVLSNCVTSSVHLHSRYGGVVPEIASRYHVEYIAYVLSSALKASRKRLEDIELVAVTRGPGLVGALLVGVSMAKALAYSLGVPLIGVNHVLAHMYSVFLDEEAPPEFPFIGLVVSGGHTSLYLCRDFGRAQPLGQTQDDAVGEAYDKVAKILGLGFPGGPVIERMAEASDGTQPLRFPKSYLSEDSLDFSFSGIKTAVLYYVRDLTHCGPGLTRKGGKAVRPSSRRDICYAFQEAALDVVVEKTVAACKKRGISTVVVGGGVSANGVLRRKLAEEGAVHGICAYFPKMKFCTDNGAMVGFFGEELYKRGARSDLSMTADPNLKV
jgi:N6-L-threonylcarbamoyladenine synthase